MSRLDKTGPTGQGSKTGRGLGRCNPDFKENFTQNDEDNYPRHFGKGRGRGRSEGSGGKGRSHRGFHRFELND
jgi:hypothetical protein